MESYNRHRLGSLCRKSYYVILDGVVKGYSVRGYDAVDAGLQRQ